MKRRIPYLALLVLSVAVSAQQLRNPLDFPITLSGGFGELRADHFHSGIDFKTQRREGLPVHAVNDGYVSRISVSPGGYGNALYLTHPDSTVTVYGHLQRFADTLARYVKSKQYEAESFRIDLNIPVGLFTFKRGDLIAYSGNTGSSAGPHLHFEVRDARTDEPLDPLPFFNGRIADTRPPRLNSLMICPVEGQGVVNGSSDKLLLQPAVAKDGSVTFGKTAGWGRIGFAINADDYMDGTTNVYGVKDIVMTVDGVETFHSHIDRFSFSESRDINTWIDYEIWTDKRRFYTKTFVEQGNRLSFITSRDRGYVTINEPRDYHIAFRLTDEAGNIGRYEIVVTGKEQPFISPDTDGATPFYPRSDNHFGAKGIRIFAPVGSLYSHLYFRYVTETDTDFMSDIHVLHDRPVALHTPAQLSLRLLRDELADKRQYGIVALQKNGRRTWVGGRYNDGWIEAAINTFGKYAISIDTVAPLITPVNPTRWTATQTVSIRLTDNLSGIDRWRATIDGEYALFEMDGKRSLIYYKFDAERIKRGKHTLIVTATDACGNESVYETTITLGPA